MNGWRNNPIVLMKIIPTTYDWLCLACDAGDPFLLEASYRCTDCDFALHKRCAEQPYYGAVLDECPPYLKAVRPQSYDFPSKVKCRNCRDGSGEEEFSAVDDCHDCLMQTNLRHKSLPTVLRNKDAHHDHRLNLVIMPFGYDYKYLCARCEAIGYSVGYKCYECNELPNFHVACALLQWWPSPIKLLAWVPASWPEEASQPTMTEIGDVGPTIMAMKGRSQDWNREVAFNLARFLKYPLIDTRDIHQTLRKSFPSSFSSQTNDDNNITTEESSATLVVASGFASSQLNLKIPVIINGPHPLTPGATWRPLAVSSGARLVIIECHPPEEEVGRQHHYAGRGDDGLSLFHVDAESFDRKKAEDIASKIHLLSRQHDEKYNPTTTKTTNKLAPAAKEKEEEEEGKQNRRKNDHLHQWAEKSPNDDSGCIACSPDDVHFVTKFPVSYYKCAECDFTLHKHCAEKPDHFSVSLVAERCPPYLKAFRPQYDFPSKVKCRNCRDDVEEYFSAVEDCHDCLTKTNLENKFLPTVLMNDHVHGHRLSLVIMPFGYDYKYLCGRCDQLGYSVGYKCYECDELPNFHVACALLSPIHPLPRSASPPRPGATILSPAPSLLGMPRFTIEYRD
ncbi:unnamed protein product [Linum tenue]|uniref:Phorbol-ester/DAG-type domain-containing protein n=1 Tax=Linum tenue TaxID=586396 RepID=A0AAV0PBN9_9ROSI|nr:unnamed protein product [Linum tenue]